MICILIENAFLTYGDRNPVGNYMFKVNNRNTRNAQKRIQLRVCLGVYDLLLRRSGVFIVNFEHISHLINFKQVNVGWVNCRIGMIGKKQFRRSDIR